MTTAAPTSLRVAQTMRATPEQLFRAWTDPAELARWWRMEGDGWAFAGADVDLRVGGAYHLAMTDPAGNLHRAFGVYREVSRPNRLAFTFDWDDPARAIGETLVTVELNDVGSGVTRVVITHERFASGAPIAGHESGWTQLLRLLDRAVSELE